MNWMYKVLVTIIILMPLAWLVSEAYKTGEDRTSKALKEIGTVGLGLLTLALPVWTIAIVWRLW